jgi:hypothetical protein
MKTEAYLAAAASAVLLGTLAFIYAPAGTEPALWVSLVGGMAIWVFAFEAVAKRLLARDLVMSEAQRQLQEKLDRYWRIVEGRPYLGDRGF